MHRLIILGPPGAGKGTQSERLARDLDLAHVATGDILRRAAQDGTDLGRRAAEIMRAGLLVPDDVMIGLIRRELAAPAAAKGFVLDGFPRTLEQAKALDALLAETGWKLDAVLYLEVPEGELVKRAAGRRVCKKCGANYNLLASPPTRAGICDACGGELYLRDDDREDTVRRRLEVYRRLTEPVVDHYRSCGLLRRVDGLAPPDAVYRSLLGQVTGAAKA